ncbi:MAG TPA: TolC family protein [Chitinivibrionales bacterium]|nr:TolC family protein [Chitinivibrionales bacterium]
MIRKMACTCLLTAVAMFFAAGGAFANDVVKLSPEKCVELAKTQSMFVKASQYNVRAQENAVKSAATAFLPTLSGSVSAMHIYDKPQMELGGGATSGLDFSSIPKIPGVTDSINRGDLQLINLLMQSFANLKIETPNNIYTGSLNVEQPIFMGGRILNGYLAAKYGYEAQKYSHGRLITEIGLSADRLFWGYVGAIKGLEAVQETRQWFETLFKDQQKMFDNGLIIELDMLNTKIQVDNFKLTEEKMDNTIRTLADQLLLFVGLPQGSEIDPDTTMLTAADAGPVPAVEPGSVDQWVAGREDLLAMNCQLKALKSLKNLQLGAYFPMLTAFGSYGANNQYSTVEGDFQKSSSIGAQLSWTLVDWGKAWRDAQKVQCQLQAAQLQADNMRDQIRLKYFELGRKVDESKKACTIAKEDLETAQKALKVAKLKYDAQSITNTELLNARNQLTGKIVAYAQARINLILAEEEFKIAPLGSGSAQQTE